MIAARSRTLLVVGALALGVPLAPATASAAAPSTCAKQTKALTTAKKRAKRAKSASAKATAKRRVAKARRSLASCRKRRAPSPKPPTAPAPAVPAPAPPPAAPAPAPAPAPVAPPASTGPSRDTLTLAPTAPSTKDLLVFRWTPPGTGPLATQQPVLDFRTPAGDPRSCIKERSEVVAGGSQGFERRFSPFGYPPLDPTKPTLPALSDWCAGAWTATVAYRDTATGVTSEPVSEHTFTVSLYVP